MYDLTDLNPDAMRAELAYRHGRLARDGRHVRPAAHRWHWRRRRAGGAIAQS
ncbi:MAG: hypothetical protein JWO57_1213 [Pseudonocardiales bacterium]|nr:hypothetical protein [Pseudonocardiales bacterium]